MSYKNLIIRNGKFLSMLDSQLVVKRRGEETLSIPIEDISIILVEDPYSNFSSRVLTELSKHGVILLFCDNSYMPTSFVLPYNQSYNQSKILRAQICFSKQIKAELWQKIIKQKINNQESVIRYCNNDDYTIQYLSRYKNEVEINDTKNLEGIASKMFFSALYGDDFIRFTESGINLALNYGYSVLHAAIIRHLCVMGFNSNLGIWHSSEKNAFNLASDLIEPFRPLVDYLLYWHQDDLEVPLSKDIRKKLVQLLKRRVKMNQKSLTVEYAMEQVVKNLLNIITTNDFKEFSLPEIEPIQFLENEL
ncbi:MAG: type II CRISPR-associated endonuclease Cas1 [Erysipelotrichales bacterium]|nr:type II CRISPR-associated endonuclease Cas1 [Erysipelotrichales bacterium]